MPPILKFGNRTISTTELPQILAGNQMLPILCRQLIINQAIAGIKLTDEEIAIATTDFYRKNQIESEEARIGFIQYYGMSLEQLEELATRELRIEKFKQATWGSKVESYFLANKSQFDKVVYSLIRVTEMEVAQELFFRIQAEEASFADSAFEYSQGQEAQTGGLIGPVELSIQTVREVLHRWQRHGLEGLWDKPGRGGKTKYKEEDIVYLEECLKKEPRICNSLQLA